MRLRRLLLAPVVLLLAALAHSETGAAGWLRYAPITNATVAHRYDSLPSRIIVLGDTPLDRSAAAELSRGLASMLGRPFPVTQGLKQLGVDPGGKGDSIVLGNLAALKSLATIETGEGTPGPDGFTIGPKVDGNTHRFLLFGADGRGELYAAFHLLELVASQQPLPSRPVTENPYAPIRWVNQWDNLDGTIERGYAGRSIFFDNGHVRQDLARVSDYGRLLASVGLNGCTPNNVNASLHTLDPAMIREFARIADALRPWGVRMSMSIDLSSPQVVGGLSTFDPLDPMVATWWKSETDAIYKLIPDFAGFVVKADSEGRAGPSQYGRTPAEAANVLARALQPHGGVVLYRGFVYNHHLDWNDLKADRARAGYDNFRALDGKFEPNVVIQIKHGPIDFQVREPVSPLIPALHHTPEAIELQTTQEYTGQQRHMVFLVPMWKSVLETDMRVDNRKTLVKDIVSGLTFHQPTGGFVSVVNVGLDTNWMHHPMAMANLYGYGKLAWNPDLSSEQIIDGWTRLTFGNDPGVVATIDRLQLESWNTYENYTGPLGVGGLTDIIGVHFGPGIDSAEHNGWGQWIRADSVRDAGSKAGIGMDRSTATGTGYIGQYPPELAATYESLKTCPDDLLLFMHHIPYTYLLHSGKTVVQHVYDSHYEGAATAASYVPAWEGLRGLVDEERYRQTLSLLTYQAGHAIVWRDAVNAWFLKMSGIPDKRGRVGHDSNRIEAESMQAVGYTPVDITPVETASGGRAMVCRIAAGCTLSTTLSKPAGTYDLAVQYFDLRTGVSHFELRLNGRQIAAFAADDTLPPAVVRPLLDGQTSTRYTIRDVALKPGDTLELHGAPDLTVHTATGQDTASQAPGQQVGEMRELAPVDYIELGPSGPTTPQ